ncbi:MAG: hypothetical protein ACI9CE_001384 [Flavobacterium sp.]|jgi:hypothetical protein
MFILGSLFLVLTGIFFLLRLMLGKSKLNLRQFLIIYLLAITGVSFIFLGLTGKLHWLFVLLGGFMPFISFAGRNVFSLIRLASFFKSVNIFKSTSQAQSKTSSIVTVYLDMRLAHDSGELDGKILMGKYQGQLLSNLDYDKLLDLVDMCSSDDESTRLLTAYIERRFPGQESEDRSGDSYTPEPADVSYDQAQALAILGLEKGASDDEIVDAHRRLIQKMHPDRGGSTYLAARINGAKSFLLKGS